MFADDFFGSWVFKSPAVFRQAIRSIGVLVQTLQRVGLALSLDKTVILLATSGTSAASVLGPYKRFIEDETYLQIPVGQNKVLFKVVGAHKYLGAKLSYQGFEALNLRHRLATAWGSFWRLHSILIHKSLAMQTRVRLWQACVMSVLRYSIHHVGLPTNGPQLIRQAVHRQLRLIARSPAHLWHVSSADILKRLNVVDPWATLCKQFSGPSDASSQVSPVTRSLTTWHNILRVTFEATHSADSPNPQWMGAVSSHTIVAPTPEVPRVSDASERRVHAFRVLTCAKCQQQFASLSALRVHEAAKHFTVNDTQLQSTGSSHPPPSTSVPAKPVASESVEPTKSKAIVRRQVQAHSQADCMTQGLPSFLVSADPQTRFSWLHAQRGLCICRHCGRDCARWDELKIHIFTRSCRVLFPNAVDMVSSTAPLNHVSPYWRQDLRDLAAGSWETLLLHMKRAESRCYQYCPICGQWLIRPRGITHHVQAHHSWASPALIHARVHSKFYCRGLALSTPCHYCGVRYKGDQAKHASECAMIIWVKFLKLLLHPSSLKDPRKRHGPGRSDRGGAPGGCSRAHSLADHGTPGPQDVRASDPLHRDQCPSEPLLSSSSVSRGFHGHPSSQGDTSGTRAESTEVHEVQRQGTGRERTKESLVADSGATREGSTTTIPCGSVDRKCRASTAGQRTLQSFGFRRASGEDGTTPSSACGCPERPRTIDLVGHVSGNSAPSYSGGSSGQGGGGMASTQGHQSFSSDTASQSNPLADMGFRAGQADSSTGHRPGSKAGGHSPQYPYGAELLQVRSVEPRPENPGEPRRSSTFDGQRNNRHAQRDHCTVSGRGCHAQLSPNAKVDSQHVRGGGHVCTDFGITRSQSLQNVDNHGGLGRKLGLAARGHDTSSGEARPLPAGASDRTRTATAEAQTWIRSLALLNRANDCYANSTILAILWTTALYSSLDEVSHKPALQDDIGALVSTGLPSCPSAPPVHLWSRPAWARLLRHWPDTGRQQDAAEFLNHFRQACALRHFQSTWHIITREGLLDSGSVCPLLLQCELEALPLTRGVCMLQSIIEAWHGLPGTPTLAAGTTCVALQLNRFRTQEGVVLKTQTPVTLPRTVHLPMWVEGSVASSRFLLSAVVFHLGSSPFRGHYRTLLVEKQGRAWLTEDGIAASPPNRSYVKTIQENAYLLFLRLGSGPE